MADRMDLTGRVFGRWYVIGPGLPQKRQKLVDGEWVRTGGPRRMWRVRCKCGATRTVRQDQLRNGSSQSCGCLHKEIVAECNRKEPKRLPRKRNFRVQDSDNCLDSGGGTCD
jgi:hypothetical protein